MAATAFIANAGVGQAADVYRFRVSNFAWVVADICVHTDVNPPVCTGRWAKGKSEVLDVPANSMDNWYCTADVVAGRNSESSRFSRADTKECYLEGDTILSYFSFK